MKFNAKVLLTLISSSSLSNAVTASNHSLRGVAQSNNRRRLQTEPCIILFKETRYGDEYGKVTSEEEEIDCYDPSEKAYYKITGPPQTQELFKAGIRNGEVISGESTLRSNGAYFDDDGQLVLPNWEFEIGRRNKGNGAGAGNNPHRHLASVGTRSMVALRIVANDAETTSSQATISDKWFGTAGDLLNNKSQYAACSYNQLIFEPASTNANVEDGAFTVNIDMNVIGVDNSLVRDAAVAEGDSALGDMKSQFDHVVLCLPPGTSGGWIAYAYINWYLSVYNDLWCNYVSGQMHEIGHNLGLAHSGEGTEQYADQSGMMGYSYGYDDVPYMCFNAPKNWQLGWYESREVTVTSGWSGNLVGLKDYGVSSAAEMIIIQIPASVNGGSDDWYVSFNSKGGVNYHTLDGADQVLVHKRASGTGYGQSWLMATLSAGGTFNEAPLPITVHSINLVGIPTASVTIGNPGTATPTASPESIPSASPIVTPVLSVSASPSFSPSSSPTTNPTRSPTTSPTDGPTASPIVLPQSSPSTSPTTSTTVSPTLSPTKSPTASPTISPTVPPQSSPSISPTASPTDSSTSSPTESPTASPTVSPIDSPTASPTASPTDSPTASPTESPTVSPTASPTESPTDSPTASPTDPSALTCNIDNCDTCEGGGACRAVGCTWSQGSCFYAPTCGPDNCESCTNGRECKRVGCLWSKGECF